MLNIANRLWRKINGVCVKIYSIYKTYKKYRSYAKKKSGKNYANQLVEMIALLFKGYHEEEYYILNLYDDTKDYVSTRQFNTIIETLNPPNRRGLVDSNKYILSQYLTNHNLPTPKCYGILHKTYGFTTSFMSLRNLYELRLLLKHIDACPIVFKPAGNTRGGFGVFAAEKYEVDNDSIKVNDGIRITLESFYEKLKPSLALGVLIQEKVLQHDMVAKIHPFSTNCARIYSVIDGKGNMLIIGAIIKFGSRKSVVDNSKASKGVFSKIDIQTGVVGPAYEFFKRDPMEYHPYTLQRIEGLELPYWNQALELVKKAHTILAFRCGTFGWDIAFGQNMPIIIEANSKWDHNHFQKAHQMSLNKTILKQILDAQ